MNCPNCGSRILEGASFCGNCGVQVGIAPFRSPQFLPPPKKDNKVLWIVVLVIVLVTVVPVVLSALLYVMVLGFGGTSVQTPTSSLTKTTVIGGEMFTFAPMSRDTQWGDVNLLLSDGYSTAAWSPQTTDLTDMTSASWSENTVMANLGTLKVNITIVDLMGNGMINQGDHFTLTLGPGQVFSPASTYTITIMHVPSSAVICNSVFQG